MNDIKATNRQSFFPKDRKAAITEKSLADANIKTKFNLKKDFDQQNIIENDSKVEIPQHIKDFARIKKAVDAAPEIDNEDKIQDLRSRVKDGSYNVDYEALAEKILGKEF